MVVAGGSRRPLLYVEWLSVCHLGVGGCSCVSASVARLTDVSSGRSMGVQTGGSPSLTPPVCLEFEVV